MEKEIIRFYQREGLMHAVKNAITAVESNGGMFGGRQHEQWLQMKQALIQCWMDDYLGSYARLTTWRELDSWAEESNIPLTMIINSFRHLCRDSYGSKPSKSSVMMYANQVWMMEGRRMPD